MQCAVVDVTLDIGPVPRSAFSAADAEYGKYVGKIDAANCSKNLYFDSCFIQDNLHVAK